MQRYIWSSCGCFDARIDMPFFYFNWTCGYSENSDVIAFPEKYNATDCVNPQYLFSNQICEKTFRKVIDDLICLKKIKKKFAHWKMEGDDELCQCPEACDSFSFETYYSLANWPNEGAELEAAYQELVLGKMVEGYQHGEQKHGNKKTPWWMHRYFEGPELDSYAETIFQDTLLSKKIIKYLSNPQNKVEILKDFIRLTIYIKDLTVETTQDVAEYPWESLLSDIGKGNNLLSLRVSDYGKLDSITNYCIHSKIIAYSYIQREPSYMCLFPTYTYILKAQFPKGQIYFACHGQKI